MSQIGISLFPGIVPETAYFSDFSIFNQLFMKTDTIQQEILLLTSTTFSKRRWHDNDISKNQKSLTEIEQLEEICWNGLLNEMLPEIVVKTPSGKNLYLWQIRNGQSYLQIELCEFPTEIEKVFSIDPHFFLESMNSN